MSVLVKNQKKHFVKVFSKGGKQYEITARVRHDDDCGNGHNSFSITGEIWELTATGKRNGRESNTCGCIHEDIAKHFPQLAPLIKWHLCSTDGPMHYPANVLYLAGDRDCWGLRKGESRQLRNGKTGKLSWILEASRDDLPKYIDADEMPTDTAVLSYKPWLKIGEGKERELNHARSSAIWPEATEADLINPNLEQVLRDRLPALMTEFRAAVESLGFVY